ncbi:exodeoxyribonuclease VII small subunit [Oscillatoria sp. CS-180]|uniref:exodeoxyribonuclease VII small subunit n=1 Tax=Oscillatoria sp. CS-180 TaxID=3021720 RepID=UPI00232E6C64|nr:exodeoxyribonuclease VII small subunit [Oscillatoria sp. CS-180]MDB9528089.1 exodeoxyribonuclease VII small subunit [Oscillatoria sp. CS-180]
MTRSTKTFQDWSYEETIEKIEATVTRLEQGDLPLSAVLNEFENAVQQIRQCEDFLQTCQKQADLLIETLEDC